MWGARLMQRSWWGFDRLLPPRVGYARRVAIFFSMVQTVLNAAFCIFNAAGLLFTGRVSVKERACHNKRNSR